MLSANAICKCYLQMLSANARVFQTLAIAIIAMFIISRSEIITFAEEFFKKTIAFADEIIVCNCYYIKIVQSRKPFLQML